MRRGYCCFLCQKFKIDGSMTQQTVKMTQSFAIYCMQLHFAFVFFLSIIFSIDFNNQTAMSADGRAENLKLIDRNYAVCEFKSGMQTFAPCAHNCLQVVLPLISLFIRLYLQCLEDPFTTWQNVDQKKLLIGKAEEETQLIRLTSQSIVFFYFIIDCFLYI